jgi:hypothetical protein
MKSLAKRQANIASIRPGVRKFSLQQIQVVRGLHLVRAKGILRELPALASVLQR